MGKFTHIGQVMSNVFGVPVKVAEQPDSASLGAAYRALHAWKVPKLTAKLTTHHRSVY